MRVTTFFINTVIILFLFFSSSSAQTFKEVKIGNQVWMAENLNVFYFRNGDPIPIAKSNEDWTESNEKKQPACCYYQNKAENGIIYGVLYNWYAINDSRGIAPKGWHIPSNNEWNLLISFLGNKSIAGKKMKSDIGWSLCENELLCNNCSNWSPSKKAGQLCSFCLDHRKIKTMVYGNGNNESAFCGLPGGIRDTWGQFQDIGEIGDWWSTTEKNHELAYRYFLNCYNNSINFVAYYKGLGSYVRCIKNQ